MEPNAEKSFRELEEQTPTNSKRILKDNEGCKSPEKADTKVQSPDAGLHFRDKEYSGTKRWSDGSNYDDTQSSGSSANQSIITVINGDETLKNSTMEATLTDEDDLVAK